MQLIIAPMQGDPDHEGGLRSGTPAGAPGSEQAAGRQNRQELRARLTREALCQATIACLDRYGYSETSISRITDEARVSRGALTHHYRSKEDLIVDALDRMLQARIEIPLPSQRHRDSLSTSELIRTDLLWVWRNLDTRNGRALVEVLLASRTDAALQDRISDKLHDWNTLMSTFILESYRTRSGRDEDVLVLWDICRVFFRGLLIQKAFVSSARENQRLAEAFIALVSDGFLPR